jgi:DNA-binding response OmpR family regulator
MKKQGHAERTDGPIPAPSPFPVIGIGASARDTTPLAGQRTLIVDDNRDAADSLCQLLASRGANAAAVYDGRAALEVVNKLRPDAILLDIGMPGMDGYEVAKHIRADRRFDGIRIIALTGWGSTRTGCAHRNAASTIT